MPDALRGRFVWHELMTSDPRNAAAFYTKLIGWKTKAWEQDPSYTLLLTGDRMMAGAMALPPEARAAGAPPHWMCYIGTPDADATARQTAALGGKVLRPAQSLPGVGRFVILQDPQGAAFAAYTPQDAPTANSKPGLGDFSWHELATTDWATAFDFYRQLFGWEKTESMDMGPGGTYQMYGWQGQTLGGMFNKPANMPGPPSWLAYAVVPDSRVTATKVAKLGGRIVSGPMQVPGGSWIAVGMDPQGAMFAVHSAAEVTTSSQRKRPTKKAKGTRQAAAKKAKKRARPSKAKSLKSPKSSKASKRSKSKGSRPARKTSRGRTSSRASAGRRRR
jgi:predicted enzyme related to lactoylglutathione lyase